MKVTLTRQEVEQIVKSHFNITTKDFKLEIMNEKEVKTQKIDNVEYDITIDSNGFITDMVPKKKDATGKLYEPIVDIRGTKYNYENTCKVCGRTFFTIQKPADICSGTCLEEFKQKEKKAVKDKAKVDKIKKDKVSNVKAEKYSNSTFKIPKKPKVDYTKYGLLIEEFLNSDKKEEVLSFDGLKPMGAVYRYVIAAKMFGYSDKITISGSEKRNGIILKKVKEKV